VNEKNAMKTAIVILSDPATGSEEALGRVFNALATAYDCKARGTDVTILFQGAGTRWIGELERSDNPVHALYTAVMDKIAGASAGCAAFFGSTDEVTDSGHSLIGENPVPGTPGLPSIARLVNDGYSVITF